MPILSFQDIRNKLTGAANTNVAAGAAVGAGEGAAESAKAIAEFPKMLANLIKAIPSWTAHPVDNWKRGMAAFNAMTPQQKTEAARQVGTLVGMVAGGAAGTFLGTPAGGVVLAGTGAAAGNAAAAEVAKLLGLPEISKTPAQEVRRLASAGVQGAAGEATGQAAKPLQELAAETSAARTAAAAPGDIGVTVGQAMRSPVAWAGNIAKRRLQPDQETAARNVAAAAEGIPRDVAQSSGSELAEQAKQALILNPASQGVIEASTLKQQKAWESAMDRLFGQVTGRGKLLREDFGKLYMRMREKAIKGFQEKARTMYDAARDLYGDYPVDITPLTEAARALSPTEDLGALSGPVAKLVGRISKISRTRLPKEAQATFDKLQETAAAIGGTVDELAQRVGPMEMDRITDVASGGKFTSYDDLLRSQAPVTVPASELQEARSEMLRLMRNPKMRGKDKLYDMLDGITDSFEGSLPPEGQAAFQAANSYYKQGIQQLFGKEGAFREGNPTARSIDRSLEGGKYEGVLGEVMKKDAPGNYEEALAAATVPGEQTDPAVSNAIKRAFLDEEISKTRQIIRGTGETDLFVNPFTFEANLVGKTGYGPAFENAFGPDAERILNMNRLGRDIHGNERLLGNTSRTAPAQKLIRLAQYEVPAALAAAAVGHAAPAAKLLAVEGGGMLAGRALAKKFVKPNPLEPTPISTEPLRVPALGIMARAGAGRHILGEGLPEPPAINEGPGPDAERDLRKALGLDTEEDPEQKLRKELGLE